jgi:hypothetical protein
MQRAEKWLPQPGIEVACADISFTWVSEAGAKLVILMHFSRVIEGLDRDLELTFDRPLAFQWEDESYGLIETPGDLPKCAAEKFKSWTHPTLRIEGSRWRETYANRKYASTDIDHLVHFFLVSMNDLVHVLAENEPSSRWIEPGGS